ncbi:hypothetical protein [Ottowia sp.]|uniref:hypothetical protein n=1 Tax=Ottowia sp. TaxID=1898956 RepID=UPI002C3E9D59|nr:hypothetical protein [Ottowia sp.]HRN76762.1 hypothetical protein [Ottowia sp.]
MVYGKASDVKARLIARLYRSASQAQRVRVVRFLLRPLSPLALVAVAGGAFSFAVVRDPSLEPERLSALAGPQVAELADFALQVDPAVLAQVADVLIQPAAATGLAAAAMALLWRRRQAAVRDR